MTYSNFVEIGRVVYIHYGADRGKLAVIIDILNENKVLIDGPTTGVARQLIPIKRLSLTRFTLKIKRNASTKSLTKAANEFKLAEQWNSTKAATRRAAIAKRARLTDFERFRAMVLKRRLAHGVKRQTRQLVRGNAKKADTKKTAKK